MRRMLVGSLAATLVACVALLGSPEANAKVDTCKRACAVVFKRGGGNCVKKVQNGIKRRQQTCKSDFRSTGFSSVQKCRTAARIWGNVLRKTCTQDRFSACITCCGQPGGTKDKCAPVTSPSGAFLDLDGPLM